MPLVDFLGKFIGPHCEVVLHDLVGPERTAINIANGLVSGRSVGTPLTDFALRMIKNKAHASADFLHEYEGALKNGKRVRSSTLFIKDESGELVGLLCLNQDVSRLQNLHDELDAILAAYFGGTPAGPEPSPLETHPTAASLVEESETFGESIEELISAAIAKALAPYGLPPERLSPHEREAVIDALHKKGFFQFRGAVEHVAAALGLSEATIYRYLKSVQKKNA